MPIAQMREYAVLRERGAVTTEPRLRLLEAHQAGLHAQIALLRTHEKALAAKIATYQDDLAALQEQPTGRNLTALGGCEPQLDVHINAALNVGLTPQQIIEALLHTAVYCGFPRALNATFTAKKVFAERGLLPVA